MPLGPYRSRRYGIVHHPSQRPQTIIVTSKPPGTQPSRRPRCSVPTPRIPVLTKWTRFPFRDPDLSHHRFQVSPADFLHRFHSSRASLLLKQPDAPQGLRPRPSTPETLGLLLLPSLLSARPSASTQRLNPAFCQATRLFCPLQPGFHRVVATANCKGQPLIASPLLREKSSKEPPAPDPSPSAPISPPPLSEP